MPRIARIFNICALAALFCLFLLKSVDKPAGYAAAARSGESPATAKPYNLLSSTVLSLPAAPQAAPALQTVAPSREDVGEFIEYASTIWYARSEAAPTEAVPSASHPETTVPATAPTPAAAPVVRAIPAPAAATPSPTPRSTQPKEQGKYREVWAVVTAYCPCSRCCGRGSPGRTSLGTSAWKPGMAADPRAIAYGTRVYVPGYGLYTIDDTGGAMRRSWRDGRLHIDIRMTYHWQAKEWGNRLMKIRIYKD